MRRPVFIALSVALLFGGVTAVSASADTTCTAGIGGVCGAYSWTGWPGSNGYNTYVVDQSVDVQSGDTGSITATSPSGWSATADYASCGGCVQTYTAVQQLTNNWTGAGWTGPGPYTNTPLNALSKLQVAYSETSPAGAGNQYEFAPDLWTNYSDDIMLWADTSPVRCDDNGLNTGSIIGQANLGGQNWTVYRYGGQGGEIVFILDGSASTDPVSTDTCAQQESGTLHVLAALKWVSQHRAVTGAPTWANQDIAQLNTGWEITDADGTGTYSVSQLSYDVAVK
jgi:hypothetical protein